MKGIIFTVQFTCNYTYTQEARKIHIEISSTVFCTFFSHVLRQKDGNHRRNETMSSTFFHDDGVNILEWIWNEGDDFM